MPLTVLIAEDDEDIATQYEITLEALGHVVTLTKNGVECIREYRDALQTIDKNRPTPYDVVVIDYLMPIMDGITLAKEILKQCPQQRIIFVTGHGPKLLPELNDFEDKVEVLVKPISMMALMGIIEKRRTVEIVKKLYSKLKKWDGFQGLSVPVGQSRAADTLNVYPD